MVDYAEANWPVDVAAAYYRWSERTDTFVLFPFTPVEVETRISEGSVGVLKIRKQARHFRPFLGAGIAWVKVEQVTQASGAGSAQDSDTSFGGYAEGGVNWRVARYLNIGVHARFLLGTRLDLHGGDADYAQVGFVLGWGWPGKK